jgi:hypothetical protein
MRPQKRGLAVKEFELIRKNFSATGNFGEALCGINLSQVRCGTGNHAAHA